MKSVNYKLVLGVLNDQLRDLEARHEALSDEYRRVSERFYREYEKTMRRAMSLGSLTAALFDIVAVTKSACKHVNEIGLKCLRNQHTLTKLTFMSPCDPAYKTFMKLSEEK